MVSTWSQLGLNLASTWPSTRGPCGSLEPQQFSAGCVFLYFYVIFRLNRGLGSSREHQQPRLQWMATVKNNTALDPHPSQPAAAAATHRKRKPSAATQRRPWRACISDTDPRWPPPSQHRRSHQKGPQNKKPQRRSHSRSRVCAYADLRIHRTNPQILRSGRLLNATHCRN